MQPNFKNLILFKIIHFLSTFLFYSPPELSYFCYPNPLSMSFFNNKVVVITGGSDGIGKALIDALVPLGAKIATCARNYDKL
jgi:hypothetical protein